MTANERDDVRRVPAERPELMSNTKRDGDHADMASRDNSTHGDRPRQRKLVTQGRPREALKKRAT
ncbi:hypothetical protein AMC85_CH03080 [Rhizobium phaseoli]|nr:hypothetical protein AMC88_CH03081 [Rhizobium phaseoli]ANL60434.1 hypothetical protein AMC85_CH03080 [Rhizobium phaseoli]